MIKFIVGSYQLQQNDILIEEISSATCMKNFLTKNKNLVGFTSELGLTKKEIDELIEVDNIDITLIVHDGRLLKGKRKETQKYTIEYLNGEETQAEPKPYELAKYVFKCTDRQMLFEYLKDSKNSLFVLIKYLSCNILQMNDHNRRVTEWLCEKYFKVKYEVVCAKIAFDMKLQNINYIKWLYPKKKEQNENV